MRAWLIRRMLKLFRRVSRFSLWFETRFTSTGRLVIAGTVAAAIFGVDPNQTAALQLAAVLLGIIAVAITVSLRWQPKLELKRTLPDTVTVGSATLYYILITNNSDRTQRDLVLSDHLQTRYPTADMFRQQRTDGREKYLNWFDRRIGFPRWLNLLRLGRGARLASISVPPIPARSTITVSIPLLPLRRGKLIFTEILVKRPDPLGIFFAKHQQKLYDEAVSLPKRYPLPPSNWVSERHFHHGGLTRAAAVGDSEEFIGLREYRPGDPLRHIHWRSFAKRGSPVVNEYQDEYFDRHALVIDTFIGSAPPSNFEALISIAASFIQTTRPSDSILDLAFIEQQMWQLTTGRGISDNRQVLMQLAEVQPSNADEFSDLAAYLRRHAERLASVIMVCTIWDGARQACLEELQSRRLRCLGLLVGESEAVVEPNAGLTLHRIRPSLIERDIAAMAS